MTSSQRAGVVGVVVALVAAASLAWAAGVTLTSAKLGAAAVTTPSFFPISLALQNGNNKTAGQADQGDVITVVFSQQVKESSICSSWSGTGTQVTTGTFLGTKNGAPSGNDSITLSSVAASCTGGFHFGTIDLGRTGYFTSATPASFAGSNIVMTQTTTQGTFTIVLGTRTGSVAAVGTASVGTYTPNPALTNVAGTGVGANKAATASTVLL